MKFTLAWLKEHLDTDATLDTICARLTALGLEVESVADPGRALAPFTIAQIVDAVQHPDADRLRVCTVDTGSEKLQIVCGAPNAQAGLKTVLARPGDVMPDSGQKLKKGVIRGVESQGMLCAADELKLTDVETDGILELPADAPVGANFAAYAKYDDPVIEINLTPNRADCAGVRGIARDLAAAGLGTLKPVNTAPVPGSFATPIRLLLDLPEQAAAACPFISGRHIKGIRNGESPKWLQDRLKAIGLRPISAIVDITNYVTYDLARPLHAFDAKKLQGNLRVHLSKGGESLALLNGKTYQLQPGMTVISDDTGPLELSAIMGGQSTSCEAETNEVYLISAYFDPVRTAKTGRLLNVTSDARYRFERGIDPLFTLSGAEFTTRLIVELCGTAATRIGEMAVAGSPPPPREPILLSLGRCAALTGVEVPADEQAAILTRLGCEVKASGTALTVAVPGWRPDVTGAVDLVEEIIRVKGFATIPATSLPRAQAVTGGALDVEDRRAHAVRHALAAQGLLECVTWSFMSSAIAAQFGAVPDALRLRNPISSDLDVMRPNILGNLVQAAKRNADRGFQDVQLFEAGPVFSDTTPAGQVTMAAALRAGATPRHWTNERAGKPRAVDAYDAKADALAALAAAGAPMSGLQIVAEAPAWYHPGRAGSLRMGPLLLATFGELHPDLLTACDAAGPLVACEIFFNAVPAPRNAGSAKPPLKLAALQAVERDFAFVLDRVTPAAKLVKAVRDADKALIRAVTVFDLYEGDRIGADKKSLALSVTLQPVEKSLTDAEIEAVSAKIIAAAAKAAGAVLRG